MPGTIDQYPNWTRKVPQGITDIFNDEREQEISEMFREEGRS